MNAKQKQEQAIFKRDHKRLCAERAMDRCDYDAANIFYCQAEYWDRVAHDNAASNKPLTETLNKP